VISLYPDFDTPHDSAMSHQPLPNESAPFLAAYAAAVQAGDAIAALTAASCACHAAPDLPEPHYAYGEAWLAQGDAGRAEQAFAAAIRCAPLWAEPWVNFGIARYRQGAIQDAKTATRRALQLSPHHPVASANLAAFMRISGEADAAEALLSATILADPDNAGARLNLAVELLHDERPAEALTVLDAAPGCPVERQATLHWRLQRSLALLQLGRANEARTELAMLEAAGPIPAAIAPLWHWRYVLLAMAAHDPETARCRALSMQSALADMGPGAVLEHQIMARYNLAKFWSGQNEPAAAFAQWREGHALLKRTQPFSRHEHLAVIEANIAAFTADRFAAARDTTDLDPTPVFIVGMPRSGTTLCEQILAAHAQVHGAGERHALSDASFQLGGTGAAGVHRIARLDEAACREAAAAYLAQLHALAPGAARIIDKMPGNYINLGLVGRILPGARIIHCVRDPRDIGLSIFTFRFHGSHGYAHDLADLGWTIVQQERLMAHWRAVLPNPILSIRLSDWVDDFDATLIRVLAHIDLPPDPNCVRFYEADSRVRTVSRAQVRQPINARGLGRWRAYAHELAPLISELDQADALASWQGEPA
jgi:tetratricopeptide (TPR) repeat protein